MDTLTDLVRRQTALSVESALTRQIDRNAEELARELMREPEFVAQMRTLMREAFTAALRDLQAPS